MLEVPPAALLVYTKPATIAFLRAVLGSLSGNWQLTSWYRDAAHNRSVGGNRRSQHLLGLAVDVVGDRWSLSETAELARALDLTAVQEGDHLHLQMFRAGQLEAGGYDWLYQIV